MLRIKTNTKMKDMLLSENVAIGIKGNKDYRISSVMRRSFFSFQNNLKDLDPACKMDLDLWDCLERVKLVL